LSLAVVQHKSAIQGLAVPGTITLAATPTVGNLLILFLHCNIGAGNITVNTAKWTKDADCLGQPGNITQVGMTLYRYVQVGDTVTVPAPWTAGTSYTAYEIYEISGVSGTWATDHEDTQQIGKDAGTATTTLSVSHTTVAANALLLAGAGQYNGSHNPTWNGGWTSDETSNNNTNYGSQSSAEQAVASATAITATVTYGGSSQPADLLMVTLKPVGAAAAGGDTQRLFPTSTSIRMLPTITQRTFPKT
jgi:hypothetical protein